MAVQLVWFKRDLRVQDHRPLWEASQRGPCIFLYVYEDELLQSDEMDSSHQVFIQQSLKQLRHELAEIGGMLILRKGCMTEVLEVLYQTCPFEALWSHEETGNHITYMRDKQVAEWIQYHNLIWHEFPQTGVVRLLQNRDGWSRKWNQRMICSLIPTPSEVQSPKLKSGRLLSLKQLGLPPNNKTTIQVGDEQEASQVLDSFLSSRGVNYRKDMSSPVTAWEGCSRLSTYLSFGNISMKQVYQAVKQKQQEVRANKEEYDKRWLSSLQAYAGRLRWHCHFMQKLEDEPDIEFHNMNRAYDGLREEEFNQERFDAWCHGKTGYPMVDACMRALHQSGWINFRMRAMLVSFASYHLWLHWRPTSVYLAKHFLDFEPGIHFSQAQMQSGTTGINAVRIYSPIKQVTDHDPEGVFIKQYVPELEGVPNEYLPQPHTMPHDVQVKSSCIIGKKYPEPVVNHSIAYNAARQRIYARKRSAEAKSESQKIYKKHGSRRRLNPKVK